MFISKEEREKILLLNQILGMNHRSKPFDFTKKDDIIEAVELVTAEYVDMSYYWGTISNINSLLDESIEYFYPAEWMSLSLEGTTNDDDINEAINAVDNAEDALAVLMDRAEEKCKRLWELILLSNLTDVKKHFFGEDITVDIKIVKELLEEHFFEICNEIKYDGNIENSTMKFAKGLLKFIKQKIGKSDDE